MQKEYLVRLSDDIRKDVKSIEQLSRIEILVEVDSSREKSDPAFPDTLACQVDEHSAKLLIPSQEHFPNGSVLHEILHIKRFLVDGIPKIVICDEHDDWSPEQESGLIMLDNQLEHFAIVPQELKRIPCRESYWKSGVNRALISLGQGKLEEHDFKQVLLMHWVFLNLVIPDEDLISKAGDLIRQADLGNSASEFLKIAASSVMSKERLVRVTCQHLDISIDGICLQTIDSHQGTVVESKLSDVEEIY